VIRRGFWMGLGAALGVTGYRRASKLARVIRPTRRTLSSRRSAVNGTAAFLRDVRDGMDEYLDQHPQPRRHPQ
jgi:hypothetical protein